MTTSSSGIATCILETPIFGFTTPYLLKMILIFVEGIEMSDSGDGYNSADYDYKFFKVISYNDTSPAQLTFQLVGEDGVGLTTNPGIAKTYQSGYATIINKNDYPEIKVFKKDLNFAINEGLYVDAGGGFVQSRIFQLLWLEMTILK